MTITSGSDNGFNKVAGSSPFPDLARVGEMNSTMFAETAKFNAHLGAALQNLGKEWTEFVGGRLREDMDLFKAVHDCRSLQELQLVYSAFWQKAFTQYGDEAQRMLRITQGALNDAAHMERDLRETSTVTGKAA
jgi:hypothetical protein